MTQVADSSTTVDTNLLEGGTYTLYGRRWFMLAVITCFSFSNGMVWISYAPITNFAADYYQVPVTDVNWFSTVFFITFIIFGFFSFWLVDSVGLKPGVLIGTWINAIGATIRMVSSLVNVSSIDRYAIALTGQIICGCAQPLALSMPTKITAYWFGDNERTLANTISSLGNAVGVLCANVLSSVLVTKTQDIKLLVIVQGSPAILAAVMATVGFRSSKPPQPPSASAEVSDSSMPFRSVLKQALGNKNYVLLMITVGWGVGVFSAITTLLFEIICPHGYSNLIAGIAGALMVIGGLIGSTIVSLLVDRTKKFEVTTKVCALMIGLTTALLLIVTNLNNQAALFIVTCIFFGFFCLGTLPVSLELGVEITYPLAEATTSGLQWMTGQLFGLIMLVVVPYTGRVLDPEELRMSTCTAGSSASIAKQEPKDLTNMTMFLSSSTCLVVVVFLIFFKAELKRLKREFEHKIFKVDDYCNLPESNNS